MKLSQSKCQVVGLRAGEIEINLLNPLQPAVVAKFMLLRDDGTHAGMYTKGNSWGEDTVKAFENFIDKLEEEVLSELFDEEVSSQPQELVDGGSTASQDRPTLGDGKGIPQI